MKSNLKLIPIDRENSEECEAIDIFDTDSQYMATVYCSGEIRTNNTYYFAIKDIKQITMIAENFWLFYDNIGENGIHI